MCSFLIMSILVTPNECLNITLHYKLGSKPNKYWNTNKSSLAAWKLDMPRYRTLAICYQVVDRSQFKHLQTFTYNFVSITLQYKWTSCQHVLAIKLTQFEYFIYQWQNACYRDVRISVFSFWTLLVSNICVYFCLLKPFSFLPLAPDKRWALGSLSYQQTREGVTFTQNTVNTKQMNWFSSRRGGDLTGLCLISFEWKSVLGSLQVPHGNVWFSKVGTWLPKKQKDKSTGNIVQKHTCPTAEGVGLSLYDCLAQLSQASH